MLVAAGETSPFAAITLAPARPGRQLVRLSVPCREGGLLQEQPVLATVSGSGREVPAAVRALTTHYDDRSNIRSIRRALITFPYDFPDTTPVRFAFHPASEPAGVPPAEPSPVRWALTADGVTLTYADGTTVTGRLLAPARTSTDAPRLEVVERNAYYSWERLHIPDPEWPRVIEVRTDALGTVAVVAHLQRDVAGNDWAPELGWEITGNRPASGLERHGELPPVAPAAGTFALANESAPALRFAGGKYQLYHPVASAKQQGRIELQPADGRFTWRYLRSGAADKVPMQQTAWRKAEFVVAPAEQARLTWTLQSPHAWTADWRDWDALYQTGAPLDLSAQPELAEINAYHRQAILRAMCLGPDLGNVTEFNDDRARGGEELGWNRLNFCPPIFALGWRNGDRALLDEAVLWCENFHDLTVWWGDEKRGGTRYPNDRLNGLTPPDNDDTFMWRSNKAFSFCTKGCDSFYLAYEETGDPRMWEAFQAQVDYALRYVSAVEETRNIGDVRDFVRLARYTGDHYYQEAAQRLFAEYDSRASWNGLVSQQGKPIEPNPPFIDDDQTGYKHPLAKPYMLGYALIGLPELLELTPEEPKLRTMIRRVADFLCETQDPTGGWRYPHPRSSTIVEANMLELAWGLTKAESVLGPDERRLDAIERFLHQRVATLRQTGRILFVSKGWEISTGRIKNPAEIYQLYRTFGERDLFRDYREGAFEFGRSHPEGVIYFEDVLRAYLSRRPATALLTPPKAEEPLGLVLARETPRVTSHNPDPARLPSLTVWQKARELEVTIRFPGPTGVTCHTWCYEGGFDFIRAEPLANGGMNLIHRVHAHPHVLMVTTFTPESGAVDVLARLTTDPAVPDAPPIPEDISQPNLCWQLRPDLQFSSYPEVYPEFVRRCFIYTAAGLTFLDRTDRKKIPDRDPADRQNNPPWVQYYPAAGAAADLPATWMGQSSTPFVIPVIGAVSRDRHRLAAVASGAATAVSQVWQDCMHNNPPWLPKDAPMAQRHWHVRIYSLGNDPADLQARVRKDFQLP